MKKLVIVLSLLIVTAFSAMAEEPASTIGNNEWFKGKVGVCMYSYRQLSSKNLNKSLEVARSTGFVYIEYWSPYKHSLQEYRSMVEKHGLIPVSHNFDFNLWEKNPQKAVQDAITLGVKYAGTAYLPCKGGHTGALTEEEVRHHAEVINRAAKMLAEHGMKFMLHNHSQEFAPYKDGKTMFDLLMELIDPENVVIELDIAWAVYPWKVNPVDIIKKYPNRIKLLHIRDVTLPPDGSRPCSVPVGKGVLPIKEILLAAQEAGVEYYLIEDDGNQPLIDIPETIKNMEEMK
ncbi:MAG: TIM barrel protein [Thermoguttaceae bacterium]|nr:TIM barrel protein [Thermoguttaceae bacterium]